jgi:pyruvate dehydrogenase E2 component (dihydrolipoamide acetyltransferase)
VVRDGAVVPGHQLTLTLACDHRIVFGALAADFLRRVTDLIEA